MPCSTIFGSVAQSARPTVVASNCTLRETNNAQGIFWVMSYPTCAFPRIVCIEEFKTRTKWGVRGTGIKDESSRTIFSGRRYCFISKMQGATMTVRIGNSYLDILHGAWTRPRPSLGTIILELDSTRKAMCHPTLIQRWLFGREVVYLMTWYGARLLPTLSLLEVLLSLQLGFYHSYTSSSSPLSRMRKKYDWLE